MEKITEEHKTKGLTNEMFPGYHKTENRVYEITQKNDEIHVLVIDTSADVPYLMPSKLSDAVNSTMVAAESDWQFGLMKVRRYCHKQLMK